MSNLQMAAEEEDTEGATADDEPSAADRAADGAADGAEAAAALTP